jgi:hypothetical protein
MQLSEQQAFQVIRTIEETATRMIPVAIIPETHMHNAIERLQGLSMACSYADAGDGELLRVLRAISDAQARITNKLTERAA